MAAAAQQEATCVWDTEMLRLEGKTPLQMGYSNMWMSRDTEQVAQGCFSFGFWNAFIYLCDSVWY